MAASSSVRATPGRRPRSILSSAQTYDSTSIVYNYTIPLRALQAEGASHKEIVRRLRLNLAIRLLLEAEAAMDQAGGE